jgi:hypothetical protein
MRNRVILQPQRPHKRRSVSDAQRNEVERFLMCLLAIKLHQDALLEP